MPRARRRADAPRERRVAGRAGAEAPCAGWCPPAPRQSWHRVCLHRHRKKEPYAVDATAFRGSHDAIVESLGALLRRERRNVGRTTGGGRRRPRELGPVGRRALFRACETLTRGERDERQERNPRHRPRQCVSETRRTLGARSADCRAAAVTELGAGREESATRDARRALQGRAAVRAEFSAGLGAAGGTGRAGRDVRGRGGRWERLRHRREI